MFMRIALFLVMALGLAGFATVLWISTQPPAAEAAAVPGTPNSQVQTVTVLAAARPLRPGELLKPQDLMSKAVETKQVPEGAVPDGDEARRELTGTIIRRSVAAGQPLAAADMVRPGEHGFLAAVLGPNQRAVTVGVDMVSGTAGLIWPGDRVDLILTQTLEDQTRPLGKRVAAETVLADVRVIAIDQQLAQGVAPTVPNPNNSAARTVTLEVSANEAERVSVSTRLGRLSLVVRSAERGEEPQPLIERPHTTWGSDVSPALGVGAGSSVPSTMRVFQGSAEGKEFKF